MGDDALLLFPYRLGKDGFAESGGGDVAHGLLGGVFPTHPVDLACASSCHNVRPFGLGAGFLVERSCRLYGRRGSCLPVVQVPREDKNWVVGWNFGSLKEEKYYICSVKFKVLRIMKGYLLVISLFFSVLSSFAAGIEGKWNVKNLNNVAEAKGEANSIVFGILGGADVVEFKENGTFYANDTVYGKYSVKGSELVMKRDEALVAATKKKLEAESGDAKDSLSASFDEFLKGYAEDSLIFSFTKSGNTMLVEINQSMNLMKLMPFAPLFLLEKPGTAKEDWNQGVKLSGTYSVTMMGMMSMDYTFKPNGVLTRSVSFFGREQKEDGTYSLKNSVLTTKVKGKEESMPFYMGKNCLYLVISKDGSQVAMPCWKK